MTESLSTKTVIDPAELDITYIENPDGPIVHDYTTMTGQPAQMVFHGALKIMWNSPKGKFFTMKMVQDKPHPDDIDERRIFYAMELAQAYDEATKDTSA